MFSFQKFKASCKGNTTVMFALALVPLLLGSGVAVDMVQTNYSLTVLQGAADAAALAGGSSGKTTNAELKLIVEDYLQANGAEGVLSDVDEIGADLDKVNRTFTVKIEGKRKTSLMFLAGINEMKLNATSVVNLGGDGLEVSLVLDNTASMSAAGRMPALKAAATELVDDLLKVEKDGAYVRIGIVPFAEYVNVGLSRRGENWLEVPDDFTKTEQACWNTYPNATSSNCHDVPAYNDGIPSGTTQTCDWNYGTAVEMCGPSTTTSTWYGCVGSRPVPLDVQVGSPSTRYPGLPNIGCTSELVDLTNDASKLHDSIDALTTVGNTYIPAGLLWGWNMLDSNKPLDKAKPEAALAAMGGKKALVLMTDGENTLSADAPYHWGSDKVLANTTTASLCQNIKDEDIVVFTVAFMVTDTTAKNMLSACATDAGKAFSADSAAQLAKAFEDIGSSLMAMRISK
jgi:Flp pilus assembly protein TadG